MHFIKVKKEERSQLLSAIRNYARTFLQWVKDPSVSPAQVHALIDDLRQRTAKLQDAHDPAAIIAELASITDDADGKTDPDVSLLLDLLFEHLDEMRKMENQFHQDGSDAGMDRHIEGQIRQVVKIHLVLMRMAN